MSSLRLSCRVDILCSSSSLRCLTEETRSDENIISWPCQQRSTSAGGNTCCLFTLCSYRLTNAAEPIMHLVNQGRQNDLRSRSSASRVGFCWPLSGSGWDASSCWRRSRWISCRISLWSVQTYASTTSHCVFGMTSSVKRKNLESESCHYCTHIERTSLMIIWQCLRLLEKVRFFHTRGQQKHAVDIVSPWLFTESHSFTWILNHVHQLLSLLIDAGNVIYFFLFFFFSAKESISI